MENKFKKLEKKIIIVMKSEGNENQVYKKSVKHGKFVCLKHISFSQKGSNK